MSRGLVGHRVEVIRTEGREPIHGELRDWDETGALVWVPGPYGKRYEDHLESVPMATIDLVISKGVPPR